MSCYHIALNTFLFFSYLFVCCVGYQSAEVLRSGDSLGLPKVFLIGEHEDKYERLYKHYETILLSVCNDDMAVAFSKWVTMTHLMEDYSKTIRYNLDGIKLWIKIFWNQDGTISHIAFYLKPKSRLVDVLEIKAFFSSFMNNYKMDIESDDSLVCGVYEK